VAGPEVASLVTAQAKEASGASRLGFRDRELGHLPAARIQAPEVLLAEARVPRDALRVDDDVVRRDGFARQVVLGVDDARGAPAWTWKRLQLITPFGRLRQVDGAEILGGRAVDLHALVAALLHQALGFA